MSVATLTPPKIRTATSEDTPSRFVGSMTVAEYVTFERNDLPNRRYEYADGKVFYVAGASPEHNRICVNITTALALATEATGDTCEVFGSDQKVYVRPEKYVYPDATLICGAAQFDFADALRNPCAVFEVLSPSTEDEDRGGKFREYQQIDSLRHYILIDQNVIDVTHFAKGTDEKWNAVNRLTTLDATLSLDGGGDIFALPLARIYRRVIDTE